MYLSSGALCILFVCVSFAIIFISPLLGNFSFYSFQLLLLLAFCFEYIRMYVRVSVAVCTFIAMHRLVRSDFNDVDTVWCVREKRFKNDSNEYSCCMRSSSSWPLSSSSKKSGRSVCLSTLVRFFGSWMCVHFVTCIKFNVRFWNEMYPWTSGKKCGLKLNFNVICNLFLIFSALSLSLSPFCSPTFDWISDVDCCNLVWCKPKKHKQEEFMHFLMKFRANNHKCQKIFALLKFFLQALTTNQSLEFELWNRRQFHSFSPETKRRYIQSDIKTDTKKTVGILNVESNQKRKIKY